MGSIDNDTSNVFGINLDVLTVQWNVKPQLNYTNNVSVYMLFECDSVILYSVKLVTKLFFGLSEFSSNVKIVFFNGICRYN